MPRPAHCRPIARSSPAPPSKSTSLSAVTQCYPRQPGKRLWRSNQLRLNTECDGSHYSKFRAAKALTTIDYLNIRCRGFHARHLWVALRGEEVDCPPLVYWYCLSFKMTKTILPRKCHTAVVSCFSPVKLLSCCHLSSYCVCRLYELYQMFHELCLCCIIVFQN